MIDPQMYTWMEGHGIMLSLEYVKRGDGDDCAYWWAAEFVEQGALAVAAWGPSLAYRPAIDNGPTYVLIGHSLEPTSAVLELLRMTSGQYMSYLQGFVKLPLWNLTSTQESVG